jgi:hypothetical protein
VCFCFVSFILEYSTPQTIQANDIRLQTASSFFFGTTALDDDLEVGSNHHGSPADLALPATTTTTTTTNTITTTASTVDSDDHDSNDASARCLVCLESWQAGDVLCQSTGCRHAFHQGCIVAWLVQHHRADCPCCRQDFCPPVVPITTGASSPLVTLLSAATATATTAATTTTTVASPTTSPDAAVRTPPAEESVKD